jgi:hypothetical protein
MLPRSSHSVGQWKKKSEYYRGSSRHRAEIEFNFRTPRGYALYGDSCFNNLHDGFQSAWDRLSSMLLECFQAQMVITFVISDSLHG